VTPSNARLIWETEMSSFDAFDPSIGNGLMVAQWVHDAIANGVTAWHYWWLLNLNGDNEGLIGHNVGSDPIETANPSITTKRVYTVGNFSKCAFRPK
jgi:glucuronoarabinoxylan endo-1,4-beta-xylanase